MKSDTFLGHPKGLVYCFLTEMWERFAYYGMLSLLILYLTKHYLLSDAEGNLVVAAYGAMVWMFPVLGGIIADRFLGSRKAVIIGGLLMAFGFVSISFPAVLSWLFPKTDGRPPIDVLYFSMATVIIGVGFLKPNITTVVGALYEQEDPRRDTGFTAFYMAINIGGALGAFVCGGIGHWLGMQYGFSAAGFGMLVGLAIFLHGQKYLGNRTDPPFPDRLRRRVLPGVNVEWLIYLGGLAVVFLVWQALNFYEWVSGTMLWFSAGVGVFILYYSVFRCSPRERNRMLSLTALILFTVVFWSLSMQIFGSLVLFSDRLVDREVLGLEIAASQLQGLPATIMIAMTPVVGFIWIWLSRRKGNPNIPVKFSIGLVFSGLAFMMPAAGLAFSASGVQIALFWFLMIYWLMVTGELCIAPIALSMITKLAPRRIVGMMIGANFLALTVASLIGGGLAARYTVVEQHADGSLVDAAAAMETYTSAYSAFGAGAIGFGILLYLLSPLINYFLHDHNETYGTSRILRLYRNLGIASSP